MTAKPKIPRCVADLVLDDHNANRGTERGGRMLQDSLQRFGAGRAILLDRKGRVMAGNKTVERARALGMDKLLVVPSDGSCLVAVQRTDLDLEDAEARALAIADNRIQEVDLEWNPDVLAALGQEVDLHAFWSADELEEMLGTDGTAAEAPEPRIDVAEELQGKWETARAQVWEISSLTVAGKAHRIMCGDGTSDDVTSLLGGGRAVMAFTDPPWNVGIGEDSNPRHRQRSGLVNDSLGAVEFGEFLGRVAAKLQTSVSGDVYCVLGFAKWPQLDAGLREAGFHWSTTVIWVKDCFVLGQSKYHSRYEPIWYGWHEKAKSSFLGRRDLDDVWEIPRPRRSEEHPTMKPPELPRRAIENSSLPGDVVLDLFLGAGSTLVAAEQAGRLCYGMEIEPKYVAVTLQRAREMGLRPRQVPA